MKEYVEQELRVAVAGQQENPQFFTGIGLAFIFFGGVARAQKTVLELQVSDKLTRRRVYGYLWADMGGNAYGSLDCQIVYFLGSTRLLELPFSYVLGTIPQTDVRKKSVSSGPLCGGVPTEFTRSLTLYNPGLGGGAAAEPNVVIMHPHPTNFACDKISLEILGGTNVSGLAGRFYLLSIAE
jgi:hypothetical protein